MTLTIDELIAELRNMALAEAEDVPAAVMTHVDMIEWDAAELIEEMHEALSKIAAGCDNPREAARLVIDERERRLRRVAQSASPKTGSG